MHEEGLRRFSRERLGGRPVPEDLRVMLTRLWDGEPEPAAGLRLEILAPGAGHPLLDHSSLTDADRADPDLMANIAAFDRIFEHACFVAIHDEMGPIGYWFHPDEPADRPAPIILLDDEGTFHLLPGTSLAEAEASYHSTPDEEVYAEIRDSLATFGILLASPTLADIPEPAPAVDPEDLHIAHYEELRKNTTLP